MASYRQAIDWIADNDDTEWVDREETESVTAALVADLFGKPDGQVRADLRRALNRRAAIARHDRAPA